MQNVFLSQLTTLGIGGRADEAIAPQETEFKTEFGRAQARGNVLVLGRGSKVLASDAGFRGVVLLTRELNRIEFDGTRVYVGAGVTLPRLALACAERGLSGLEWACGIPASFGGAVALHAGAFGGCMGDVLREIETLKGDIPARECGFGYRTSIFRRSGGIVTGAWCELVEGDGTLIRARMRECTELRRSTQPAGKRTAGSCFLSVHGVGAGYYLERAGCKGRVEGGASVSCVHANFIQNDGSATCQDVRKLLHYMQRSVRQKFGIELTQDVIEV